MNTADLPQDATSVAPRSDIPNQDEHLETPSTTSIVVGMAAVRDEHYITVLQSRGLPQTKRFTLENGELKVEPYSQAKHYDAVRYEVHDLDALYALLRQVMAQPSQCLVRGVPHGDLAGVRRTNENFPEPTAGVHWVMADIDGMKLPEGVDSLSLAALELCIEKLPPAFHACSYVYQFSSSAGIVNPDGTPRKPGLSAHIFFWLRRPAPTSRVAAFLKTHCLETGFYTVDSRNALTLRYGIDMAMLNSSSQPHYVAAPIIEPGVQCLLLPDQRLGLVRKETSSVTLPEISPSLIMEVRQREQQVKHAKAVELGLKSRFQQALTDKGISQHRYYGLSPEQRQTLQFGRPFQEAKVSEEHRSAILYFEGEGSPGSWRVHQDRPTTAVRFGDNATVSLLELSFEAYCHVRDVLRWFREVPHRTMSLDDDGHLPPFASFLSTKHALLLAPTGSGKTHRYIEYAGLEEMKEFIKIYAAPRIVLVQQMANDLRKRFRPFHVYDEMRPDDQLQHGHVLTTTQSLHRVLERVYALGLPYVLTMDEIHVSVDEIMRTGTTLAAFERAFGAAHRVIMMTGTLTDLQRRTLSQIVYHATPTLTPSDYGCFEFDPKKSHPLEIRSTDAFPQDLLDLLTEYEGLQKHGATLPKVVLILDTSKLERFRILLEKHGLLDQAEVVSRKESTDDEVDEAVLSSKPILVTTSLFAVGLNLPFPPARLWCCFDHIGADTNQIVQAINRANRTDIPCEVRIYARSIDRAERMLPRDMPEQVRNALADEASIAGYLEEHLHIDRLTYRMLREHEKDTPTALGTLIRIEGFQNYKVVDSGCSRNGSSRAAKQAYAQASKEARSRYDLNIVTAAQRLSGFTERREYFDQLETLRKEMSERHHCEEPRTDLEIDDDRQGALSRLCDLGPNALAVTKKVSEAKVAVLFGERFPWHSEQYKPEVCADHGKVKAEKLEAVWAVLGFLDALRQGNVTESLLINAMTRGDLLQRGLLALEWGEKPYQQLHKRFELMKKAMAAARGRSKGHRELAGHQVLSLLHDLLREIGVYFKVGKDKDGRKRTDFTQPVVPAGWDLEAMRTNLKAHAERFRALPAGAATLSLRLEDMHHQEEPRTFSLCQSCVFLWRSCCSRGYSSHGVVNDYWTGETSCEGYQGITARHAVVAATKRPELVATII